MEKDTITVPGQAFACLSIIGPACPQKTDKLAIKIRGVFATSEDAKNHAKKLQQADAVVDIYVVDMYSWLIIPPDPATIEDSHYTNEKLQELMDKYQENQRMAASMFEERKRGMMAKPLPNGSFIEPGDENSKFYSKPDVPPLPHPADVAERHYFDALDAGSTYSVQSTNACQRAFLLLH
jgi:hypothetical protein